MRSNQLSSSRPGASPPASSSTTLVDLRSIGTFVADRRRAAGWSQTVLGQKAGLSRMPVYRLEAGRDIALSSLLAILQALGTAVVFAPLRQGPLRASDLAEAFAHLHDEDSGDLEELS